MYGADREVGGVGVAPVDVEAAAHAVDRVVRVHVGKRVDLVHAAAVDVGREELAGAEDVRLRDRGRQRDASPRWRSPRRGAARRSASPSRCTTTSTWSGLPSTGSVSTVTSPKNAVRSMRRRESWIFRGVVVRALELAHLAPHHLVARLVVAGDVDAPHVDAPARVDDDAERDGALLLVDGRDGVGVGEGVAVVAQAVADRLGAGGELLAREHVAGLELRPAAPAPRAAPASARRASPSETL